MKREVAKQGKRNCFLGIAGEEKLVNNTLARKLIATMPNAEVLELPEAKHEILMERDEFRNEFLTAFEKMLLVNDIKEKLKPF